MMTVSDEIKHVRDRLQSQINDLQATDEGELSLLLGAQPPTHPTRLNSYAWRSALWFMSPPRHTDFTPRTQHVRDALNQLLAAVAARQTDPVQATTAQLLEMSNFVQAHPIEMTDSNSDICVAFQQACDDFDLARRARAILRDDEPLFQFTIGAGLSPNVPP